MGLAPVARLPLANPGFRHLFVVRGATCPLVVGGFLIRLAASGPQVEFEVFAFRRFNGIALRPLPFLV